MSGEESFLRWLRGRRMTRAGLVVPIGDDAAVFREPPGYDLVVTTDALAEGTHFDRAESPSLIGRKALAVNLSDIAAMGAAPRVAVATVALPRGFPDALPRGLYRGMEGLAKATGVVLAGGDTIAHEGGLVVSVTIVGRVPRGRAITRSGARVGDVIAVTGALGGSLRSGRHLRFEPRLAEARALVRLGPPTAMMDVSDGLLLDVSRLLEASACGGRIEADRVPVHRDGGVGSAALDAALSEGEDFELVFTMPPARFARVVARWKGPAPITKIGRVVRSGFSIVRNGRERRARPLGYEHR